MSDAIPRVGDVCPDCRESTLCERDGRVYCAWCNLLMDILGHYPPVTAEWVNVWGDTPAARDS